MLNVFERCLCSGFVLFLLLIFGFLLVFDIFDIIKDRLASLVALLCLPALLVSYAILCLGWNSIVSVIDNWFCIYFVYEVGLTLISHETIREIRLKTTQ